MRFLIWGAGAIGGTIGAYLLRAGHDVTLVDVAKDHVEAINTRGLHISGPLDQFSVAALAVLPSELKGRWSTILLCTKAQHSQEACQALQPYLSADGYVVSVQNGLNEVLIADIVGIERTLGSFVNFGADYLEAGHIHYGGRGAVVLGELDGQTTARLEHLHKAFLDFDNQAIMTANIWGYLWGKMAYGALLYATALSNEAIADVLALADYQAVFIAIAREVLAITEAKGIGPEGFNGFDPAAFRPQAETRAALTSIEEMVAFNRRSAKTHSGIWRDLAVRKRKTEVDAHLGMIVQQGQALGLASPLLSAIMGMIHEIEAGERQLSLENLAALSRLLEAR